MRIYNRALSASEIRALYDIPDVPPDVTIEPAVFLSWEIGLLIRQIVMNSLPFSAATTYRPES